jgi:hypothetical protein
MQMFGVRSLGLGAALTFGAVLWWATRGTETDAEGFARLREASASHADAYTADTWAAPADKDDPAGAPLPPETAVDDSASDSEASFDHYVSGKFQFLIESVGRSPRANDIHAALLQRERLVVAINTAKQGNDPMSRAALPQHQEDLAATDRRIAQMLPAQSLTAFEVLKDSHIEQFQFDDYAQGIANVAPLRDAERKALLLSKLATRHRFREVLDQSGLMRGDLPAAQRQGALADVSRALRESRDSFLQEARQHLADEEQYSLLANYENTEFNEEMEKLRRIAGGAGS